MLNLLRNGLACYRLARLLATEDGPADVFIKLRSAAGVYDFGADGRPATPLGRLLECPYCLGMWIALALAIFPESRVKRVVVDGLAIAGMQTALQSWTGE